ncbi:hypothetical protein TNCT_236741 [Trichonephila clavata]|uniref:Uncharacterized protein n=1 Tax=Trichonephila clavata TaxID=2740835 RepID=A0A8X6J279_TRICU|nr:hypothetical protein TNCT_236741 [Trichonephila clavata]
MVNLQSEERIRACSFSARLTFSLTQKENEVSLKTCAPAHRGQTVTDTEFNAFVVVVECFRRDRTLVGEINQQSPKRRSKEKRRRHEVK